MKPTGLTDILPFYQKPTNLKLGSLTSNRLGIETETHPITLVRSVPRLYLDTLTITSLKPQMTVEGGEWFSLELQVSGQDNLTDIPIQFARSVYGSAFALVPKVQPLTAYTNSQGRAQFFVQVSNPTSSIQQTQLQFDVLDTRVRSSPVFLTVSPGQRLNDQGMFFDGSQDVPYHDVARVMAAELFESVEILAEIDSAAIPREQRGSSGPSAYHGFGIPALTAISAHLEKVLSAYRRIQGSKERTAGRTAGFSTNILHNVHKLSELPIVTAATLLVPNDVAGYAALLAKAGKASASAVASTVPDYAYGNAVKKASVLEQTNAQHVRISASATYNVDAGFMDIAATQIVTSSRFSHVVTDTHQVAAQYVWERVEKQKVEIAQFSTQYVHGTNSRVLNHNKEYVGLNELYSDSLNLQVGTLVGPGVGLGPKGFMNLNALTLAKLSSSLGAVQVGSLLDTTIMSTTGKTSLVSVAGAAEIFGGVTTVIDSVGITSINSDALLAIDAPFVFINMNKANVMALPEIITFPEAGPVPLATLPPLPFLKTPADSAGSVPKQFPYTSQPEEVKSGPDIGKLLSPAAKLLPQILKSIF